MPLADHLDSVLRGLPPYWTEARVRLVCPDSDSAGRAAAFLAPLTPGRSGNSFTVVVTPPGAGGATVSALRDALARLDANGIDGTLTLGEHAVPEADAPADLPVDLAVQWDDLEGSLPPTWTDTLLELTLSSSDDVDRGALLLGPANPLLLRGTQTFRFRVARSFGYGASTEMARRSLERLDEESIRGTLRTIRVMSDSRPVATQGPVWRLAGRSV